VRVDKLPASRAAARAADFNTALTAVGLGVAKSVQQSADQFRYWSDRAASRAITSRSALRSSPRSADDVGGL